MANAPQSASRNCWIEDARGSCSYIDSVYFEPLRPDDTERKVRGQLSREQISRCTSILKDLSPFLEKFGRITSHPLFTKDFFDCTDKLRSIETGAPLWSNPIFHGCVSVADAINDEKLEKPVGEQGRFVIHEEPLPAAEEFTWLKPSKVPSVHRKVNSLKSDVDQSVELDQTEKEEYRAICAQIAQYIAQMRSVFEVEGFVPGDFYKAVFGLIRIVDMTPEAKDVLERRVDRLYYAKHPAPGSLSNRSSRAPSAVTTPSKQSKQSDSSAPSPSAIAAAVSRIPLSPSEREAGSKPAAAAAAQAKPPGRAAPKGEKEPLVPKGSDDSCCVLI